MGPQQRADEPAVGGDETQDDIPHQASRAIRSGVRSRSRRGMRRDRRHRLPPVAAGSPRLTCRWDSRWALSSALPNAMSSSAPSCAKDIDVEGGNARMTSSVPAGRRCIRCRTRWRSRRRTRLRATAPPTARPTTNPARAGSRVVAVTGSAEGGMSAGCGGRTCTVIVRRPARWPPWRAAWNSLRRRSRACAGSTRGASGGQPGAALAPARSQDCPAGSGAHPEPETVCLGAAAVVGLKRSLGHGETPGRGEVVDGTRRLGAAANHGAVRWPSAGGAGARRDHHARRRPTVDSGLNRRPSAR